MVRQIGRRGNCHDAKFIDETHGNHIFRNPFADANAGVEPAAHDIAMRIVGSDFEFYFRKFCQELLQQRTDERRGDRPGHAQAQRADGLVAERIDGLDGLVHAVQDRLRIGQQALTGFRQRHAASGAVEKAHAKSFLKGTNGLAQRGRRNRQLSCRLREVPVLRYRHESAQLSKSSPSHSKTPAFKTPAFKTPASKTPASRAIDTPTRRKFCRRFNLLSHR